MQAGRHRGIAPARHRVPRLAEEPAVPRAHDGPPGPHRRRGLHRRQPRPARVLPRRRRMQVPPRYPRPGDPPQGRRRRRCRRRGLTHVRAQARARGRLQDRRPGVPVPRRRLRRARVGRRGGPERLHGTRRAQRPAPLRLCIRKAATKNGEDHGSETRRRKHHRRTGRHGGHAQARHGGRDGRVGAVQTRGGTKEHPDAQPIRDKRS